MHYHCCLKYLLSGNCIKKKSNYIRVFMSVYYNLAQYNLRISSHLHFERSGNSTRKNLKVILCSYGFCQNIKIEPTLVATKVTGSQIVEVTVMAYVLSTRSGIQKSLRLHRSRRTSNTATIQVSVNFFFFILRMIRCN
jgi:hypothetical protein